MSSILSSLCWGIIYHVYVLLAYKIEIMQCVAVYQQCSQGFTYDANFSVNDFNITKNM